MTTINALERRALWRYDSQRWWCFNVLQFCNMALFTTKQQKKHENIFIFLKNIMYSVLGKTQFGTIFAKKERESYINRAGNKNVTCRAFIMRYTQVRRVVFCNIAAFFNCLNHDFYKIYKIYKIVPKKIIM